MLETIGRFGCTCSIPAKKLFLYINTFLVLLIMLFWICGMVGWSEDPVTLSSSAWSHANYKYDQISGLGGTNSITVFYEELYFGLQGYYSITTSTGSTKAKKVYQSYADSKFGHGESCEAIGQVSLGLLLVSFFICIALLIITFIRTFKDNSVLKTLALLITSLVWIFSVAAYGGFNEECIKVANNDIDSLGMTAYRGFNIVVSGWVFTTIIFFIHLLIPSEGDKAWNSGEGIGMVDSEFLDVY